MYSFKLANIISSKSFWVCTVVKVHIFNQKTNICQFVAGMDGEAIFFTGWGGAGRGKVKNLWDGAGQGTPPPHSAGGAGKG